MPVEMKVPGCGRDKSSNKYWHDGTRCWRRGPFARSSAWVKHALLLYNSDNCQYFLWRWYRCFFEVVDDGPVIVEQQLANNVFTVWRQTRIFSWQSAMFTTTKNTKKLTCPLASLETKNLAASIDKVRLFVIFLAWQKHVFCSNLAFAVWRSEADPYVR